MSYAYIKPGLARLLILAMEHDFPAKVAEWKKELEQNRMTTEMRTVFDAMGYDVPRARRVTKVAQPEDLSVDEVVGRELDALTLEGIIEKVPR